jgi:LDH2 family malate/lactate/ureidoglycolate dehydrogenase
MLEKKRKEIETLVINIFQSTGVSYENSKVITETLIDAEITGIESHGLMRLKPYIDRIQKKLINPNPNIKIVEDKESLVVIDGDNGLGQIVASETLEYCFNKLNKNSVIMATVRNSNHFGTSGYYSRKAAEKGYLALIASNASPTMAPWGGKTPLLGTNPIAMSFPAGKYDNFTLDMATSATAKGKIRNFERTGRELPLGLAVDKDGNETTDARKAIDGTLLPIGQHKGYGLSMFIDVLCAGLSQANLSYESESMFNAANKANIGHFFLLIKLEDILDLKKFNLRMDSWFDEVKSSDTRPGFEDIFIPGEIENKRRLKQKDTMLLNEKTYEEIVKLAVSNGVWQ